MLFYESVAQCDTFFIKVLKLADVFFHSTDNNLFLRTNNEYRIFGFKAVDHIQLLVVELQTSAKKNSQAGIITVDKARLLMVFPLVAPAFITGTYNNVLTVASCNGALNGNGIGYTSVEHRLSVDVDNLAHIRQTARSPRQFI